MSQHHHPRRRRPAPDRRQRSAWPLALLIVALGVAGAAGAIFVSRGNPAASPARLSDDQLFVIDMRAGLQLNLEATQELERLAAATRGRALDLGVAMRAMDAYQERAREAETRAAAADVLGGADKDEQKRRADARAAKRAPEWESVWREALDLR